MIAEAPPQVGASQGVAPPQGEAPPAPRGAVAGEPVARARRAVLAAAAVVTAGTVLGVVAGGPALVRLPLGLAFALFVPGFALVGLLRLRDAATEVAASVALSIALGIATAQCLVWAGVFGPGPALAVLGGMAVFGLGAQAVREFPAVDRRVRSGVGAVGDHLRVPMFRSAYALIVSTALTTGLGMLGWIAAARLYPVDEVGRGQSAVNAMILLAGLGNLRLMNVLTRFLPRARERSTWLVGRTYVLATAASLLVSAGYLLLDDRFVPIDELVGGSAAAQAGFAVAVVAFALFTLQDAVLTGVQRATWVPVSNGFHGLVKLVVVVACATALPATGIFLSWALATVLALVPVSVLIFRRLLPVNAARDVEPEDLSPRRLAPFAAGEYAGSLCELAVVNVIPLVVAQQLGLSAAGVFGAAWLMGTTLDHVVVHFGASLTVEAAARPDELRRLTRDLVVRAAAVVVPISAVVVLAAPQILALFGDDYAAQGADLLRLLGLALVPRLVCTTTLVVARVRGHVRTVVGVQAALAALTLALSFALLDSSGVTGPGIAYLVASVVVALAVLPGLVRDLRPVGAR